jgi:phage regulator Rha-like protein
MNSLLKIETINEIEVVDSRLIAGELGISHAQFYRTIKDNQNDIEEAFGHLCFENETVKNSVGAVNAVKFAYLNEDQATYLMTLSRNTPKVKILKRKLVKSFSEAKKLLVKPKTALELAKEQVKLLEQLEVQKIIIENQEKDLLRQSEVIDELFNYSSIIRIAKFNNCPETKFQWQKLKAVSKVKELEIKKVPDPRFGYKNLYHHDVWRFAYPNINLPETNIIRINQE